MSEPLQPTGPVASQPEKNSRSGKWILLAIVGVLAVLFVVNQDKSEPKKSPVAVAPMVPVSTSHTVRYLVTGTARAVDITMQTPSGTSQQDNLSLPLTSKATGKAGLEFKMDAGEFLYISAQNQGESGTVTCSIFVDGTKVAEVSSEGAYSIASCDASA